MWPKQGLYFKMMFAGLGWSLMQQVRCLFWAQSGLIFSCDFIALNSSSLLYPKHCHFVKQKTLLIMQKVQTVLSQ